MLFKRKEVTHVQPVVQRTVLEQAIDINDNHLRTMRQREDQLEQRINELSSDLRDTRTVIHALEVQREALTADFVQVPYEGEPAFDALIEDMTGQIEQAVKEAAE